MGYKNVCLNCKRIENIGTDYTSFKTGTCPICGTEMIFVDHKFRPPAKSDKKGWELAAFLITNGFIFQRIFGEDKSQYINYPQNMKEAKQFIEKYKVQAIHFNH